MNFASLARQMVGNFKNCHLNLNFANEFDVVPRLDRSYVLSLVDLYRSRFALPSVDSNSCITASSDETGALKTWPIRAPAFVQPGNIILLCLDRAEKDGYQSPKLRATEIDHDTFGLLLFCKVTVHKVAIYLANVEELCAQYSM